MVKVSSTSATVPEHISRGSLPNPSRTAAVSLPLWRAKRMRVPAIKTVPPSVTVILTTVSAMALPSRSSIESGRFEIRPEKLSSTSLPRTRDTTMRDLARGLNGA